MGILATSRRRLRSVAQAARRRRGGEAAVTDTANLSRLSKRRRDPGQAAAVTQEVLREAERSHGRWLRYHLHRPEGDPGDRLLISFSSARPDTPPVYAFPGPVSSLNRAVLFIRCVDGYWFGFNRDPVVSEELVELVNQIVDEQGITPRDAIACGSSHGGRAALAAAVRCRLGEAVLGTPTIMLGDVLIGARGRRTRDEISRTMATTMAGGTDQADRRFLNDLLPDLISAADADLHIRLFTSRGDQLFKPHMTKLIELCDQNEHLTLQVTWDDYSPHSEMHGRLPAFFTQALAEALGEPVLDSGAGPA